MTTVRAAWQDKENNNKVVINVSGHRFVTTKSTLANYPETKLGKLAGLQAYSNQEHFFDEDEDVFKEILRFQRTGELHIPKSICRETFIKQIKCWNVDEKHLANCCRAGERLSDAVLEKQFLWFDKRVSPENELTWRHGIWYFLTDPMGPYTYYKKASKLWMLIYILLVCIQSITSSVATVNEILETYDIMSNASFQNMFRESFNNPCAIANSYSAVTEHSEAFYMQTAISMIFAIEITLRFISCPDKKLHWTLINTADLVMAVYEFISAVTMNVLVVTDVYVELEAECYALSLLMIFFYITIQLKIFRLLIFTTIFR